MHLLDSPGVRRHAIAPIRENAPYDLQEFRRPELQLCDGVLRRDLNEDRRPEAVDGLRRRGLGLPPAVAPLKEQAAATAEHEAFAVHRALAGIRDKRLFLKLV